MNEPDQTPELYEQSRPTGRFDDQGREIRLIGPQILAWNPATNNLSVPLKYQEHELLAGRIFFTLPEDVIDAVVAELGSECFDSDLLTMEKELSAICGNHSAIVGFWRCLPVSYAELRPLPAPSFSDELVRSAGLRPAAVNHALQVFRERDIAPLERFSRGYCGWLMTNRDFLDEHDTLLTRFRDVVSRWGTHPVATFLPTTTQSHLIADDDLEDDPQWPTFVEECNRMFVRWRLRGLAALYLPMPSKPLMAGVFPLSVVSQLMQAGGVFYLPDTMPVPSRDQLRGLLDHALHRGQHPEHLEEWLEIVRADNMARNRMDPFVRLFEIQHYWRILHQRHASAIYRKTGKLEAAFGGLFGVTEKRIHNDLIRIRKRLGGDWLDRTWPI